MAQSAELDRPVKKIDLAVRPGREKLADLQERYAGVTGKALLQSMIENEFAGRIALVSSFGAEAAVLLHMISEIDPNIPVIFLDTGKLFGETIRYRDTLKSQLGLKDIRSIQPDLADEQKFDPKGVLWSQNPDACCQFRKVQPLEQALEGFNASISGRKRFQTTSRAVMPTIELEASGRFKINPLAYWTQEDLARYMAEHALPAHPLVEDGYVSIGCMPCTERVAPDGDYRAGRWAGQDKEECGIHMPDFVDGDGI